MASQSSSTRLAPRSGFTSPQFYLGLVAVVGTFALGQFGTQLNLPGFLQNILTSITNNNIVLGAVVIAVVAGLIALSSWVETRTIKQNGPTKGRPASTHQFWQTSEFWLGLVTVVLNYLHDTGVFAPDITHGSTTTTTLLIALVYTFARSQLKQAYANAQAQGS